MEDWPQRKWTMPPAIAFLVGPEQSLLAYGSESPKWGNWSKDLGSYPAFGMPTFNVRRHIVPIASNISLTLWMFLWAGETMPYHRVIHRLNCVRSNSTSRGFAAIYGRSRAESLLGLLSKEQGLAGVALMVPAQPLALRATILSTYASPTTSFLTFMPMSNLMNRFELL